MKTKTINLYTFDELSDKAKEKAIEKVRAFDDLYAWSYDYRQSISAFCDHFNVALKSWQCGPGSHIEFNTDAEPSTFRGRKLRDFDRDHMPTGFCGDCDVWQTFFDQFKKTGDAKHAFNEALDAGFKAWRDDWESAYEDEQIIDFITANEFDFDVDGNLA